MTTRSPRYHPILFVDVTGYGARDHAGQLEVRRVLRRVMADAFREAGLPWNRGRWEDRGDGMLVVLPSNVSLLPVLSRLPGLLAGQIEEHNSTAAPENRIAVRMAVHAGSIHRDAGSYVGDAVNLAARLVDAEPLRRALDPAAGGVAIAVSEWVHREVVAQGYAGIDPDSYRQVPVAVKETRTNAWIHQPASIASDTRRRTRTRIRRISLVAGAVVLFVGSGVAVAAVTTGGGASRGGKPSPKSMFAAPGPPVPIEALHSGKCVVIEPGKDYVLQESCTGPNQAARRWRFQRALGPYRGQGNVFRLVNAASGMCLTAIGPSTGAAVETHPRPCAATGGAGQLWMAQKERFTNGIPSGHLKNVDSQQCLDVNYGSKDDGAFVVLFFCGPNHQNQLFAFH